MTFFPVCMTDQLIRLS